MKWILISLISFNCFAHSAKTIIVEAPMGTHWAKWTTSEETNVARLLELLERSATGKKLISLAHKKASSQGLTLLDVIKPGESSLTDTTLIRKFHPETPEHVVFESRSMVFVNKHMPWKEGILDLAHELTHYVFRENFNPYTINFSLKDFIISTIEGRGGEVQAFVKECQVMSELFTRDVQADSNCAQIRDDEGKISRSRAAEFFYHVGAFHSQISRILKERGIDSSFPALKQDKIKFVSSAYGVPYPLAAIQEYQTVLSKVCENDRRRLTYMQQGRAPASVEKFRQDVEQRCPRISQN